MSNKLVQQKFGAAAADYGACSIHASGPSLARLVELVAPGPEWQALDVATGAGHTAMTFAPLVARVVASDITEEMLAETRKLAAAKGLANLATARAEATALPFDDASFDLVTCRLAAHHFPHPAAFVAEVWRVLKPGGAFGLVDNISPDAYVVPKPARETAPAALRGTTDAYNAYEALRDPSHARCLGLGEWLDLMGGQGFERIAHEHMDQDVAFDPWVERMRCDPGTVAQLREMLNDPLLKKWLRPRLNAYGLVFTLQEAIIVAHKPERK
jgi:ubiquinone/menaquinone biosynthesis C-methylase UbiE